MTPDLRRLAAALRRRPLTAREIMSLLGCSKPTAYERIRGLRDEGLEVYELRPIRPDRPGPAPRAWGVR